MLIPWRITKKPFIIIIKIKFLVFDKLHSCTQGSKKVINYLILIHTLRIGIIGL